MRLVHTVAVPHTANMRSIFAGTSEDDSNVSHADSSAGVGLPHVATVSFPSPITKFSCSLTRQGDAKFLVAYPTDFSVWRVGRKGSQADNGRRALLRV